MRAENDAAIERMAGMQGRFDALRARHEDGTAPRAVAAWQLFQTPPDVAERMAELAEIGPGVSVLEPSAGLGALIRPALARHPATLSAVEVSADCCRELFGAFPEIRLYQGDFLARSFGEFDRVLMNPPFHMRADLRHIAHAREHLRAGGFIVGICMAGAIRENALLKSCDVWEPLPAGTFRGAGTGTETILFKTKPEKEKTK